MSKIIKLRLYKSSGAKGAVRQFAVEDTEPVVTADWCSGQEWHSSNQRWGLKVWKRIEDRGFVALVSGDGQWCNCGDHGSYIGTGSTALDAMNEASPYDEYEGCGTDWPDDLVAACEAYDSEQVEVVE